VNTRWHRFGDYAGIERPSLDLPDGYGWLMRFGFADERDYAEALDGFLRPGCRTATFELDPAHPRRTTQSTLVTIEMSAMVRLPPPAARAADVRVVQSAACCTATSPMTLKNGIPAALPPITVSAADAELPLASGPHSASRP
jgi:hypothetical protein